MRIFMTFNVGSYDKE